MVIDRQYRHILNISRLSVHNLVETVLFCNALVQQMIYFVGFVHSATYMICLDIQHTLSLKWIINYFITSSYNSSNLHVFCKQQIFI